MISKEDIIKDLQTVAYQLGQTFIKARQYNKIGKYDRGTVKRRFGSFKKACIIAGLWPFDQSRIYIRKTKYTDQELLDFFKSIC